MKPQQHAVQALISVLNTASDDHTRVRAAELLLSHTLPPMPEDAGKADGAIKAQGKNWILEADGTLRINGVVIGNLDGAEVRGQVIPYDRALEQAARAIYYQWATLPGYKLWVEGGTSDMQEEARRIARKFLPVPSTAG